MSDELQRSGLVRGGAAQLLRFAVVGVSNTAVDLGVTNLLAAALRPEGTLLLMAISLLACAAATLNSYTLNRRWTFRGADGRVPSGAVARFFAVAGLSAAINTSVFLFVVKYLPERVPVSDLVALNTAKLAGVAAALTVSFLGYRLGVFQPEALRRFRQAFSFAVNGRPGFAAQAGWLISTAAVVRAGYLLLTTAVYGDAVNYAWVADALARGEPGAADTFWSSLFCFWEALLRLLGLGPAQGAIAASLVPGVLLVVPAAWLARALYGKEAAWLAGALCVAHPRLVEYSCNGYPEMLYLLAFATAVALLTLTIQEHRWGSAAAFGCAFAVYTAVRNEALGVFLLAAVLLLLVVGLNSRSRAGAANDAAPRPGGGWRRGTALAALAILSFSLTLAAYAQLSRATLGTPGLFQKTSNLGKRFSEQLDLREAARETYGRRGTLSGSGETTLSTADRLTVLLRRLPRNLRYELERLPGVLLSPAPLFALLLPLLAARRGRVPGDELPGLLMLAFPLLFYPLIQLEPRLLFPILVPIHVFAAAGLVAFAALAAASLRIRRLDLWLTAAIVLLSLGLAAWRGVDVERGYRVHREVAAWLGAHVAPDDIVAGCGYGHVSTTGFLAGRRTAPRLWTDRSEELAEFARTKGAGWLVIYERYLRSANPELLPVLEDGIPGFTREVEVRDQGQLRVQVYRLADRERSEGGGADSRAP